MAVSAKIGNRCQIKSFSMPCRSHPITLEIEEKLKKIKTAAGAKPSAETICSSLSQLTQLHKCMDDLLKSSTTRVLIARQQNKKWVDDLIDESVRFLDVCGSTRDMVSQIKEHSTNLQCALRRRKVESSIEKNIAKYNCFRKKMKKDSIGLMAGLKQVDSMIGGGSVVVDSDHHQLAAVIKAVIGVSEATISVFESLLLFFLVPVSRTNRWSLMVSKYIHKGMVGCEDQEEEAIVNELESIDVALQDVCKYGSSGDGEYVRIAKCGLERLEACIESMETGLGCMFRCLVRTRSTLLDVITL